MTLQHNPNRWLRLSFVCSNCDELHEYEGDAVTVMTYASRLMINTQQTGLTIADATCVKMLEANVLDQMHAGEIAYGNELNRIFKEG